MTIFFLFFFSFAPLGEKRLPRSFAQSAQFSRPEPRAAAARRRVRQDDRRDHVVDAQAGHARKDPARGALPRRASGAACAGERAPWMPTDRTIRPTRPTRRPPRAHARARAPPPYPLRATQEDTPDWNVSRRIPYASETLHHGQIFKQKSRFYPSCSVPLLLSLCLPPLLPRGRMCSSFRPSLARSLAPPACPISCRSLMLARYPPLHCHYVRAVWPWHGCCCDVTILTFC